MAKRSVQKNQDDQEAPYIRNFVAKAALTDTFPTPYFAWGVPFYLTWETNGTDSSIYYNSTSVHVGQDQYYQIGAAEIIYPTTFILECTMNNVSTRKSFTVIHQYNSVVGNNLTNTGSETNSCTIMRVDGGARINSLTVNNNLPLTATPDGINSIGKSTIDASFTVDGSTTLGAATMAGLTSNDDVTIGGIFKAGGGTTTTISGEGQISSINMDGGTVAFKNDLLLKEELDLSGSSVSMLGSYQLITAAHANFNQTYKVNSDGFIVCAAAAVNANSVYGEIYLHGLATTISVEGQGNICMKGKTGETATIPISAGDQFTCQGSFFPTDQYAPTLYLYFVPIGKYDPLGVSFSAVSDSFNIPGSRMPDLKKERAIREEKRREYASRFIINLGKLLNKEIGGAWKEELTKKLLAITP